VAEVDRAPAAFGAAEAIDALHFFIETIVDRQLFSWSDAPAAHIKDVAFENAGDQVGLAGMVDKFRARASDRTVDGPICVQGEEINKIRSFGPALGFAPVDSLAGIFDHLPASRNAFGGINAPPMDLRASKLHPEAGVLGIDAGSHAYERLLSLLL
jgi:hypothetical protein